MITDKDSNNLFAGLCTGPEEEGEATGNQQSDPGRCEEICNPRGQQGLGVGP